MRKVLILVNQFPADVYKEEEVWDIFVTKCAAYRSDKSFTINKETENGIEWHFVYRIEPIEILHS